MHCTHDSTAFICCESIHVATSIICVVNAGAHEIPFDSAQGRLRVRPTRLEQQIPTHILAADAAAKGSE